MEEGCFTIRFNTFFQDFNPGKFIVFTCMLIFTVLCSMRLDGIISWNYWGVFAPIWIWKFLVIAGGLIGSIVWWKNPQYRGEGEAYVHFKAMLISVTLHLLLLMFEALVCDRLETGRHLWILVFIPLIFISVASIAVCVWAAKHDRTFELELFCSVNIIQFTFLALRLDNFITWSWAIVFVPLWVVMCLALIGVLYFVILAVIMLRSPDILPDQRQANLQTAFAYTCLVVPLVVFEVMLAKKLDHQTDMSFLEVTIPLDLTLVTLIALSFKSRGGNHWWFGIRKDFCVFLLTVCPCLQEYGNVSYTVQADMCGLCPAIRGQRGSSTDPADDSALSMTRANRSKQESVSGKTFAAEVSLKPVMPIVHIDMPD